ncbi:MAG: glycosyltransferase family 2 protein [Candidatus Thermoplasmatota archaeon]
MLEIIFFFLCSLAISGELALIALWYYGGIHTTKKTFPTYTPTVTIIVPCKGITKFFEENIQAICAQNYPQYKVLFIVDSYDDPAYQIIATVHHKNPHIAVHQTIPRETCSGKIAAQLTGISMASASEVYVFADSDIRPHNTWLYHLVQPLQNNEIGATTGYRWYIPISKTSYLIST